MRISNWARLALFLALAVLGRAGETKVTIGPGLHGAWVVPDQAWDGRTVLLFHGMASDMDDVGDFLKRLAQDLAVHGIASLRINFRGEGDKARTRMESTFTTRLEDAAAAREWVVRQKGVVPARLGVMGFSLGASTAIESGGRNPEWFKSMALWSSPSGDGTAMWQNDETAQRALRDGEATQEIPGWKKLTTKREFYESFHGIDFDRSLARYRGAFLTIRGSDDYLPHRDDELVKILSARPASGQGPGAASPPVEAVIIGGADHIYRVFQPELGHAARVLGLTVAWFERTL